jgi:hypothetical protein
MGAILAAHCRAVTANAFDSRLRKMPTCLGTFGNI